MPTTANSSAPRSRKTKAQQVISALEELCERSAPGTRIPSRDELMVRFDASQRAVLTALDELRRSGRIIVRNGSGTYVAEPKVIVSSTATPSIVAVAPPDHSFFDRAIEVLLAQTEGAGFSLICRPYVPREGTTPFLEDANGYLLFGRTLAPLATQLQHEGKRVVLVATPAADEVFQVPNVRGDQQKGGYLVARHLIELGHRHLASASSGSAENLRSPRVLGYKKAIAEAAKRNIAVQLSFINGEQLQLWKSDPDEARHFWAQPEAPTAVAMWNDHESLIFMGFLTYIGVRVPDQVSMVGYDNLPLSEQCHPTLTTVDGGVESQIEVALDLLVQEELPNSHQSVVVLPTLICRNSSASLAS